MIKLTRERKGSLGSGLMMKAMEHGFPRFPRVT